MENKELKTLKDLKAEDLHNFYLEAIKKLKPESFNPNANKPYSEMTEEQKFIDKFILEKIFEFYKSEAIKWVKDRNKVVHNKLLTLQARIGALKMTEDFKDFFNITEEELKNEKE